MPGKAAGSHSHSRQAVRKKFRGSLKSFREAEHGLAERAVAYLNGVSWGVDDWVHSDWPVHMPDQWSVF